MEDSKRNAAIEMKMPHKSSREEREEEKKRNCRAKKMAARIDLARDEGGRRLFETGEMRNHLSLYQVISSRRWLWRNGMQARWSIGRAKSKWQQLCVRKHRSMAEFFGFWTSFIGAVDEARELCVERLNKLVWYNLPDHSLQRYDYIERPYLENRDEMLPDLQSVDFGDLEREDIELLEKEIENAEECLLEARKIIDAEPTAREFERRRKENEAKQMKEEMMEEERRRATPAGKLLGKLVFARDATARDVFNVGRVVEFVDGRHVRVRLASNRKQSQAIASNRKHANGAKKKSKDARRRISFDREAIDFHVKHLVAKNDETYELFGRQHVLLRCGRFRVRLATAVQKVAVPCRRPRYVVVVGDGRRADEKPTKQDERSAAAPAAQRQVERHKFWPITEEMCQFIMQEKEEEAAKERKRKKEAATKKREEEKRKEKKNEHKKDDEIAVQ